MMKLFYLKGACSLAPHILLKETQTPYELEKMDKADRSSILKYNPKALVPTLVTDDGKVLTESAVILQYIADLKPEMNLMPKAGTWERYKCQEWLNYVATEIHKGIGILFKPDFDDNTRAIFIKSMQPKFVYLNEHFSKNDFFMGKNFTAPDAYAFVTLSWAKHVGMDLAQYSHVQAFLERVRNRPTVVAAITAEK
ncbi:MAG: glutathione transferase GstA [Bdellovibrionota bacterium]